MIIEITGSTGNIYEISVDTSAGLAMHCSCPAGDNNKMCKHILGVLETNSEIRAVLEKQDFYKYYTEFTTKTKEAEKLKREADKAKRAFARSLLV